MTHILVHPSYFPNIAQMAAIAQCDSLTFEVCDNYQKQTHRNRCYIAHTNGRLGLNVPIRHSRDGRRQLSAEVEPENHFPWQDQHWKSLESAYRTSPYFEFYEDELEPLFRRKVTNLLEHNLEIFKQLSQLLGLQQDYHITTLYQKEVDLVDLRPLVKAKKTAPIELEPYIQVFGDRHGFLTNLSVLDLLFNLGPSALSYLRSQKVPGLKV